MKKSLKGILHYYFATGEEGRPQFIGKKALNKAGFVINHNYVYEFKTGDKIRLLNPIFKNNVWIPIQTDTYIFFAWLAASTKEDFNIEYIPSKDNKSWGQLSKKYNKKRKQI